MARIEGVDLPRNKRVDIALTYIFGIGRPTAKKILDEAEVEHHIRTQDLSEVEVAAIRNVIQRTYKVLDEFINTQPAVNYLKKVTFHEVVEQLLLVIEADHKSLEAFEHFAFFAAPVDTQCMLSLHDLGELEIGAPRHDISELWEFLDQAGSGNILVGLSRGFGEENAAIIIEKIDAFVRF